MADNALLNSIISNEQLNAAIGTMNYYANIISGTNDPLVRFFFLSTALAVFGAFVYFSFMRISRRDIVSFSMRRLVGSIGQPSLVDFVVYVFKYIVVFPIITLLWAAVIAGVILLLSKQPDAAYAVLFATVIIGATRLLAYFSEPAAQEIAKLLPFVFLSALIFDPNFSFLNSAPTDLGGFMSTLPQAEAYFIGILLLEIILRLLYTAKLLLSPKPKHSIDSELESALGKKK